MTAARDAGVASGCGGAEGAGTGRGGLCVQYIIDSLNNNAQVIVIMPLIVKMLLACFFKLHIDVLMSGFSCMALKLVYNSRYTVS